MVCDRRVCGGCRRGWVWVTGKCGPVGGAERGGAAKGWVREWSGRVEVERWRV